MGREKAWMRCWMASADRCDWVTEMATANQPYGDAVSTNKIMPLFRNCDNDEQFMVATTSQANIDNLPQLCLGSQPCPVQVVNLAGAELEQLNSEGKSLILLPAAQHPFQLNGGTALQAVPNVPNSGIQIYNLNEQFISLPQSCADTQQQRQSSPATTSAFNLVYPTGKDIEFPNVVQLVAAPVLPGMSSTPAVAGKLDEEPLYVNAKQYLRIVKRRVARAKLESEGRIPKERRKYLHESRHKHALTRVRGEGGKFDRGTRLSSSGDANSLHESGISPMRRAYVDSSLSHSSSSSDSNCSISNTPQS